MPHEIRFTTPEERQTYAKRGNLFKWLANTAYIAAISCGVGGLYYGISWAEQAFAVHHQHPTNEIQAHREFAHDRDLTYGFLSGLGLGCGLFEKADKASAVNMARSKIILSVDNRGEI